MRQIRVPTHDEYLAYDGAHTWAKWRSLDDDWRCPGCRRTKFEILRWTKRYPPGRRDEPYEGWLAALHEHHDHSCEFQIPQSPFARFANTIICDHCNSADGAAKRKLGLPEDWSFSPDEIGQFVAATPHRGHVLDYEAAEAIYRRAIDGRP